MKIFYFHETSKQRYRVWREDWLDDQFEVFSELAFAEFQQEVIDYNEGQKTLYLRHFNLPRIELIEDFDNQ